MWPEMFPSGTDYSLRSLLMRGIIAKWVFYYQPAPQELLACGQWEEVRPNSQSHWGLPASVSQWHSAFTTHSLHLWPLLNSGFLPQIYFVFLAALSSRACSIKSHKRMPLPHSPKLLTTLTSKQLQNVFLVFGLFSELSAIQVTSLFYSPSWSLKIV